jgi:hypothetical protein
MINNNQKGVSVYLTIVIMSVLLAISLGLSSIIIGGAKMAGVLGNSIKAFHAADTGMEKALYCVKTNGGDCALSVTCANASNTFANGYGWTVTMFDSGGTSCTTSVSIIESEGTYLTTKRKIETFY